MPRSSAMAVTVSSPPSAAVLFLDELALAPMLGVSAPSKGRAEDDDGSAGGGSAGAASGGAMSVSISMLEPLATALAISARATWASPPSLSPRIAVSILILHGSVCPRGGVPACTASHPGQPGVNPCFINSTLRMYTRLGSGAAAGGGSGGKSTSRTRGAGATATSTSAPTCGVGTPGYSTHSSK